MGLPCGRSPLRPADAGLLGDLDGHERGGPTPGVVEGEGDPTPIPGLTGEGGQMRGGLLDVELAHAWTVTLGPAHAKRAAVTMDSVGLTL
jgi:hypothetical protein